MAHALAYAHKEGFAHLDFKPGNVFYDTESKHTKVIDFGIARPLKREEREKTRYDLKNLGALTEAYASYEMLLGLEPDQRDDIYGLACVTYGLLSGKHPFNRKNANSAKSEKLSPKPIKGLNRQQNKALLRALAFDRDDRTPTVDDFLDDLFPEKNPWRFLVMLLAIVAGFATWYHFYTPPAKSPIITPPLVKPCEQSTVNILKKAEEYMREERYIYPPGENALEKSQQVLVLCPNNEQAKKILGQLADFYEEQAQYKLNKGQIGACRDNIDNGLRAVPDQSDLLALKARCQ
ncbi:serine/threonine protein kinase [Candidatus Thiomargarita nelsonii]|uniref:Serine/threonine protein kinase n=1 Tax=Candidatus Thiomargarita nelsonii TaxID=1003181 RepID=A0A176RT52_9GAMM|nr:serine/threonine protein kinase [Candidatus Thiomargarita nelsonii]